MSEEDIKVKSLYKAIQLLNYFSVERPELGVSELAKLSGLGKSTVFNIVDTLVHCRILAKAESNSKYRLGIKILELSSNIYLTNDLRNTVRPYLEKISAKCNESVYFGIMENTEVLYLDTIYPQGMVSGHSIIGYKAPLYCTGIGKALLAFQPEKVVDRVIESGLKQFTPYTITDRQELLDDLSMIRRRGYALDNMEHEYGIKCIAAPVRNVRGEVVASISITGPSLRFTLDAEQRFAAVLKATISQIAPLLNY